MRKVHAATGLITTVAGTGTWGYNGDGIPATAALLYNPTGVAVDGAGHLYIADLSNQRVRRVDAATGLISTIAGTGLASYTGDGMAAVASGLVSPHGVAVDGAGHVYIADWGSSRIRKVDAATGLISTVAGTGAIAYNGDGIAATSANLRDGFDVAVDGAGHLYIAEFEGHRVRRVDAVTGLISTVAGTGVGGYNGDAIPATAARVHGPSRVAVSSLGHIYISEFGGQRIRRVDAVTGLISTVAGTGVTGYNGDAIPAPTAQLNLPLGLAMDGAGDVYIGDASNNRIRKITYQPPGAPTGVTATPGAPGSGMVTVSWTAPASAGSSSVTRYTVTGAPGGTCTATPPAASCTVSGLPNAASHAFTVRASNDTSTGPASSPAANATLQGLQTIDFEGQSGQTYASGGSFAIAPLAMATSGLGVTYSSTTPLVCSVSGATVTMLGAGTCTIAANQAGDAYWAAAAQVMQNIAIGQGVNIITFPPQAGQIFTAGGTFGISPAATGLSSAVVQYSSTTPGVCSVSGTTVTMLGAGTCTIAADQAGDANWNAAAQVTQSITIGKGVNTITFPPQAGQTFATGGTFGISPATATSGLAVSYGSTTPGVCSISGTTVTMLGAGTCTIAANQAGDANWNVAAQVTQNVTIGKGVNTITFPPQATQTFATGGTFGISPATATSGLAVSYGSTTPGVCAISGTTVTMLGAGTCTITASQGGDANWNAATPVAQNIAIGKGVNTITFGAQTSPRTFATGGGFPINPLATGLSSAAVTYTGTTGSVCTVTGSTVMMASAGTCTIAANQAGDANWNAATQVTQSITIGKGTNTITFPVQPGRAFTTGGTFSIGPAATGLSSAAVTYSSTTGGVCTVAGSTVTIVSAGTCTIAANQAGDDNWNAATQATQNVTIGKGVNTITFGAQAGQTYSADGTFAISPLATATSGLAVTYTSTTASVCTVAGSTVTIVSAGTCTLAADQAGDDNWAAAPQVTQNVAIGQGTQTITFADPGAQAVGTPLALSATASSGLTVSFAATGDCSLSGGTVSFASPGTCTVTASQAGDTNWAAAADVARSFAVAQRSRSVAVPGGTATASFTGGGAACTFDSLAAAAPATSGPTQPPADLVFAHGLLDFVLTGCDQSPVTMTITYPQALAQGTKYWKLHAGDWGEYAADVDEAAGTVRFTLVDGGAGDDDGAVNGRIVDPSGAAHRLAPTPSAAAVPVPTLGPWALGLLGLGLGLLGWRRRA